MLKDYNPTIGFDTHLLNLLGMTTNEPTIPKYSPNTYPPYNIVRTSADKYIIELALAGIKPSELDVSFENNVLSIKYEPVQNDPTPSVEYIRKGIANRSFVRRFILADTIEINDVTLNDGVLRVYLQNILPDKLKPRKLEINSGRYTEPSTTQYLVEKENDQLISGESTSKNYTTTKKDGQPDYKITKSF
jgi:molecular chaperone IbpA